MIRSKTTFKGKLFLATIMLLGIVLVLATMFYVSTERYQHHLKRSELAHQVLSAYQAVSDHTYRKLNAMGQIVAQGEVDDVGSRFHNEQALRDALLEVRKGIAAEVAFVTDEDESEELDHLIAIQRLVERIMEGSVVIRDAVQAGDRALAIRELGILRSDAVAVEFSRLIDEAILEERGESERTVAQARELGEFIETILPISIALVLALGLLATALVSRGLSRSVVALGDAADAYTSGDLEHRTGPLPEEEFSQLGIAFNHMAEELSARREAAKQSQASLQALVRERTQELEVSNQQLETADRRRRQLLADISHELRTPLTVIQGESELALRGDAKSVDEYQEAIERVREQAVHTARLVDDLLFVARAEEGNARIEKRTVPVVSLVQDVCSSFRSVAEKKQLDIVESYSDEEIVVFGDTGRLRQVFAILLDNAIRYSHERSVVSVSLARRDGMAELTVKDRGIGLTEEEVKQVFYRFYRGDSAERYAEGSGLGLPVAKAIVEAHQGQITLTGRPNEGAEATVRLPVENQLKAIA